MLTLSQVKKGDYLKIINIPQGLIKLQLLRFGIKDGSHVHCFEKIPLGPVILKYYHQQIAIGDAPSKTISVEKL